MCGININAQEVVEKHGMQSCGSGESNSLVTILSSRNDMLILVFFQTGLTRY